MGTVWMPDWLDKPDRSYWHPCTKVHVAMCRGHIGRWWPLCRPYIAGSIHTLYPSPCS